MFAPFPRYWYSIGKVQTRYISPRLFCLTPRRSGWDDLRKIVIERSQGSMVKTATNQNGESQNGDTKTATIQNGDRLSGKHNRNGDKDVW